MRFRRAGTGGRDENQAKAGQQPERTLPGVLQELENLVDRGSTKRQIEGILNAMRVRSSRAQDLSSALPVYVFFSGNPGTGKSTVSRLLGEGLAIIGALQRGHVARASGADFTAEPVDAAAIRAQTLMGKALGGILMINDASLLINGPASISAIVHFVEEHRGELIVIFSDSPSGMGRFKSSNPSMLSRSDPFLNLYFDDYSTNELVEIFQHMCRKQGYAPSSDLLDRLGRQLSDMNTSEQNARLVENAVELCIKQSAGRARKPHARHLTLLTEQELPDLAPPDLGKPHPA